MKELKVIENELVPVYETSTGEKVVYGTELHEVLEVRSNYREWISRRFTDIEAIETEDFDSVEIPTLSGGTPKKEHIIKLDTAKEMAMLERNAKGKQVRRYLYRLRRNTKRRLGSFLPRSSYASRIRPYWKWMRKWRLSTRIYSSLSRTCLFLESKKIGLPMR